MPTVEELQQMEAESRNGSDPADEANAAVGDGMSIEDMEAAGIDVESVDPEPHIEGTTGQLSLSVGGRKPDSATFKMGAKEVKIADRTQFPKGSTLKLSVVARIDKIEFRDKHDDAGEVTHTTRQHLAVPISVQRLKPSEAVEAALLDFLYEQDFEQDADPYAMLRSVVEQTISRVEEDREIG
jgi:hypothetical protein